MTDIQKLLDAVLKYDASDLHIRVGRPPVLRINGNLRDLGKNVLTPNDTTALMKSITPERFQQELNEVGGGDFGFSYGDQARFRVSIFKERTNIGLVLRTIPTKMRTFDEIGLPPVIKDVCMRPRGMILVTGPTGSGKTTTLASMIHYINLNRTEHIITVEDPIEYIHGHEKCVVTQRELGNDVQSFSEALRRALRQDPDIILVGEMRDLATIEAAVTAAETGHLVFGTLHTTGAAQTVDRIIDVFPPNQQGQIRTQLAGNLVGVISQTLMPKKDGHGRVAAFEIMFVNDGIRSLIRKMETFKIRSMIQTGGREGMMTLDDSLFNLWRRDVIDFEEVIKRSQDPAYVTKKMDEVRQARTESSRKGK
ncbi:MAG: type IV pilus twitching motility protein PilT [Planctomycetota bacterium]